jgi:arsenite methyltransferase
MVKPGATQNSNTDLDLIARMARLRCFFDVDKIARRDIRSDDIIRYYKRSSIGYSLVHSLDGSIHMSLSRDGTYDPNGHHAQVDIISEEIARYEAARVLELGCGRGYNLIRLARNWPTTKFVGIDLCPQHVAMATEKARPLSNVYVKVGDFQSLPTGNHAFDLAYSVESLCHALDPAKALSEVARVVSPGGRLLVVDAWRTDKAGAATEPQLLAISLTEKSMAVGSFVTLNEWRRLCAHAGWKISSFTDLTWAVMPNLERFERLTARLLSKALLVRTATLLFPCDLMNNVISGYLMAQSVRQGFHVYGVATLKREQHVGVLDSSHA